KNVHEVIKDERYATAHGIYKEVVHRRPLTSRDITDSIDKILLHPWLGIPIFLLVMFFVFKISFDFSAPFMDWIEGFINGFVAPLAAKGLTYLGAGELIKRVVSEALIGGVGFVLTFLPLIAVIYFMLSLLEFSGYLPRIAFLMDKFMHKLGLHGKSLVPLLLGFGCNVPAIVATRTLETRRDKLLVIAMIPFMSCPARLVVFSFFAVIFFKNPALVIFSLYLLGIVVALITALILRKSLFKGSLYHFVMELPPYRLPTLRLLLRVVWVYVKDFLYRAGTLIFAASVVIWLLLNLPPGVKNPSESIAGYIGKSIAPLFAPLGLEDWRMSTSLIPAFLAREIVLSSMATIYAAESKEEQKEFNPSQALKDQGLSLLLAFKEAFTNIFKPVPTAFEVEEESADSLRSVIAKSLSPASALAFMVFLLLYTSCLGTVATMWREVGKRFALLFLAYSLLIGWFLGLLAYRIGSFLWST
ncbi:MAG: ferrous iron transport protein B, partial [Aquificaceae bacterium]